MINAPQLLFSQIRVHSVIYTAENVLTPEVTIKTDALCWMFLGPAAIWIDGFANFIDNLNGNIVWPGIGLLGSNSPSFDLDLFRITPGFAS